MDLCKSRATTTVTLSCLLFFVTSFYTISTAKSATTNQLSYQLLQFTAFFLAAALSLLMLVAAARATMVAWITVLVLLAFSGTRRRVLARRGKTITADVAMCLFRVLFREADPRG
ncbi:PREDICTED: uncharacterized protein LOC104724807 [Camelina sativa]|uniref:Uncharacterized protein LOC104724807 n=1 Tax=Camelina sativa TaxID=90675 RepID=A0ABM0UIJ4_CAMSA|nr:PREDICTED: uncharacterized protein LOC104724807 [Camelina sativa]